MHKNQNAIEFAAKIISLAMIVVSLFLMNVNWIYSPVLSPYEGIFREAAEISDEITTSVSEYVDVDLSTTELFKDLEDGSTGPAETSEMVSNLWRTVTTLKGYNDEFDLGILRASDVRTMLLIFTAFQGLYLVVLIAGLIQVIVTLVEGAKAKVPVFLIAQGLMAAVFIVITIIGNTHYVDLRFSLTPAPFSAFLLAIPQPYWRKFLESVRIFWKKLLEFSRSEAGRRVRTILMTTSIIVAVTAVSLGTYIYYAYSYRKKHERRSSAFTTSTAALYSEERFKRALRSYGFTDKSELRKIVKSSYIIPGLKTTRTLKDNEEYATCTSMTPQGVCIAGPYLLISAYCASGEHNSVIYVINRSLHTFVKDIVVSGTPHIGGITYDREQKNIWFCDYENDSKTAYVCAFSMESLEDYELTEMGKPVNYIFANPIYSLKRTSFLDYDQQKLYIGHYGNKLSEYTSIQAFFINQKNGAIMSDDPVLHRKLDLSDDELIPTTISVIPGGVQGFAIGSYMSALSISRGINDSRLLTFLHKDDDPYNDLRFTEDPDETFTLPPMLEEISVYGDQLYLCFESAAYAYRARINPKIDRIVVLDLGS